MTKKWADFELLKMVYIKMKRKEHLRPEGLRKIVAIRATMNRGLSKMQSKAFPDVVPVERPFGELTKKIDPQWLAGFTSGESCFYVKITASPTYSVGYCVTLVFQLQQDFRDAELMVCIKEFLGCGHVYKNRTWIDFKVRKFVDIIEKIIPFF